MEKKVDAQTKKKSSKQSKKTISKKEMGVILFTFAIVISLSLAIWLGLHETKKTQIHSNTETTQRTTRPNKENKKQPKESSKNEKSPSTVSKENIQEYQTCLDNTENDGDCKDCCDCLSADVEIRKECRDNCPLNDFSLNVEFTDFDIPSSLGKDGDYSACTGLSSEQECKQCCDSSETLACGDFQYCRTACAK